MEADLDKIRAYMSQPQKKIIMAMSAENNHEYESDEVMVKISMNALVNKRIAEVVDGKFSVEGMRIKLTDFGLAVRDKITEPVHLIINN